MRNLVLAAFLSLGLVACVEDDGTQHEVNSSITCDAAENGETVCKETTTENKEVE